MRRTVWSFYFDQRTQRVNGSSVRGTHNSRENDSPKRSLPDKADGLCGFSRHGSTRRVLVAKVPSSVGPRKQDGSVLESLCPDTPLALKTQNGTHCFLC